MRWDQVFANHGERADRPQNLTDWYADLLARHGGGQPLELAVFGGRHAATPGLAFLAGYQAALRALWPAAPKSLGALCVTEQRSTRPADLGTRLDAGGLNGRKDFVTAGGAAEWLLVAARVEGSGERARLAVALVAGGGPGVVVEPGPALPLMPDIPHGRLRLSAAGCEVLPGDGWDQYVKPFRSLEDLYVLAAISAWLYGTGVENHWPLQLRLRLQGLLAGCAGLVAEPAQAPASHLLLAGLFSSFAALRAELDAAFATGPEDLCRVWQRDQRILDLAHTARQRRLESAMQALGLSAPEPATVAAAVTGGADS